MITEVSAFRAPSPQGASNTSAGDVSAETSSALDSDAPWDEGAWRAETSRILVFVLVGGVSQSESPGSLATDLPDKLSQTLCPPMFWSSGEGHPF